ncbi:hypothetical protein [Burkholderia alba]|uniref:hypothetical protein n=1 Tax=Burkholderia alba TaxID=2683677 RepID=UPI002B05887E|nr:hypothetical protein [Burkholderia alba]
MNTMRATANFMHLEKNHAESTVRPKRYRISEAMMQISVSPATIYRMVVAGTLRFVKIGTQGGQAKAKRSTH